MLRAGLRERCAIFHLHDPELIPWGLFLRALGKRVVYDAHEDLPKDIGLKAWIPRPLRGLLAFAARFGLRLASRGFSASVAAVPSIAQGVASPKIETIYNYPVFDDIPPSLVRPWSQRSRAAVYAGSITPARGLWEMLEAMASGVLPADARLTLAGKFDDPAVLEAAQRHAGWKSVEYTGWLEGDALWRTIADTKIGVVTLHPTPTYLESMPTKLFEYMALGLPVVASDFPAWRAIVEPSGCGLIVDPLDSGALARAMAWLLANPTEAAAMGERGRQAAYARYQWSAEGDKLVALYAELRAPRQRRAARRYVAT